MPPPHPDLTSRERHTAKTTWSRLDATSDTQLLGGFVGFAISFMLAARLDFCSPILNQTEAAAAFG